jgi:hypothetical protein
MTQLHFRGAMIFSNINGIALADERFWPVWEKADELGAVMFIHPTHPANVDAMGDYWLTALAGFLFDTTLAAGKLVFSGVAKGFLGSPGCSVISAALFRTWPNAGTADTGPSKNVERTSISRRASISKSFTTTLLTLTSMP